MPLSSLTDDELDQLFAGITLERYTSETIIDLPILNKELQRIRRQGYAIDLGEGTRMYVVLLPLSAITKVKWWQPSASPDPTPELPIII